MSSNIVSDNTTNWQSIKSENRAISPTTNSSRDSISNKRQRKSHALFYSCKPAVIANALLVLYATITTWLLLSGDTKHGKRHDRDSVVAVALRESVNISRSGGSVNNDDEKRFGSIAEAAEHLGLGKTLINVREGAEEIARITEDLLQNAENELDHAVLKAKEALSNVALEAAAFSVGNSLSGVNDAGSFSEGHDMTLTAYLEPIYQSDWLTKPLPVRNCSSSELRAQRYPRLNSCAKLPEQWPVDDSPTDEDPFLPWIHDVFPTADGRYIQFVAQNKRRCQSGTQMVEIKRHMQPQSSLFQHVPVKRLDGDHRDGPIRYRLSSHEDADKDGLETRFICRFKPSGRETLSVHNINYDHHTMRKGYMSTFTEEGFDNHMIWTSQLLFKCPVPEELIEIVRTGTSVKNDYATLFIDLVPIRTPPRYGPPVEFLPPRYEMDNTFIADDEWGTNHLLPLIEDSGRWANIPVCKPSLMTYSASSPRSNDDEFDVVTLNHTSSAATVERRLNADGKPWDLIACVWMSASFQTRGGRRLVTDNSRRLHEWLEWNLLSGFDHVIIYDNSDAQTGQNGTLQPVTDEYPERVTRINWPCKVCNNRPGTGDNKGERSSQYAAESSCRLRFGPHTNWLGSFDVDEYLIPMGTYDSMKDVLRDMDKKEIKILTFKSIRAWPRLRLLQEPPRTAFRNDVCPRGCFEPVVPKETTFMQTYNCDREETPRYNIMPAEKQIYRPDYVLLHFVHYSTVTAVSIMSTSELSKAGLGKKRMYKEKASHVVDEDSEARMLHSKSIKHQDTRNWRKACRRRPEHTLSKPLPIKVFNSMQPSCKLGTPFPPGKNWESSNETLTDAHGWVCNCFVNDKIEHYWVPKLVNALNQKAGSNVFKVDTG